MQESTFFEFYFLLDIKIWAVKKVKHLNFIEIMDGVKNYPNEEAAKVATLLEHAVTDVSNALDLPVLSAVSEDLRLEWQVPEAVDLTLLSTTLLVLNRVRKILTDIRLYRGF